jgi:magnesium chelatase family protein
MSHLGRTWSVSLTGVHGELIEVEATIESGLPRVTLVGLPDAAVSEARDRCRAAVVNSEREWPNRKLTIGLYPANKPKTGTMHDLAIALAVLAADAEVPAAAIERAVVLGELSLDGRLRPLPGILPATMAAADAGFRTVWRCPLPEATTCFWRALRVLGRRCWPSGCRVCCLTCHWVTRWR